MTKWKSLNIKDLKRVMQRQEKYEGILTEIVSRIYENGTLKRTSIRITGRDERAYWISFHGEVPQDFVGRQISYNETNVSTWGGLRMETWQMIARTDGKGNCVSPNINAHRVAWGANR